MKATFETKKELIQLSLVSDNGAPVCGAVFICIDSGGVGYTTVEVHESLEESAIAAAKEWYQNLQNS